MRCWEAPLQWASIPALESYTTILLAENDFTLLGYVEGIFNLKNYGKNYETEKLDF